MLQAALLAAGCVQTPPESVATPYGVVRADTAEQARELAETLVDLRPRVVALLPDAVDRSTEVWLDSRLRGSELADDRNVAAVTNVSAGRIQLRGDDAGIDLDFLLAHELVHALMGESWDPLPAVMKEGLCDTLAARLVPRSAAPARALRLFAARFAFGDQALDLALNEPGLGGRWGTRIDIASPGVERRGPMDALALRGRGVRLQGDVDDEDALYGYGLLVVERSVDRVGLEGLHMLCIAADEQGEDVVPGDWLLWAAGLDADPRSWDRALAEAFGPPELDALTAHLAEGFHMNFEIHHGGNSLNNVANLHVAMAIRNCEFFEVLLPAEAQKYGLVEDITVGRDGLLHAPTGPGLGYEIDFALIERKRISVLS